MKSLCVSYFLIVQSEVGACLFESPCPREWMGPRRRRKLSGCPLRTAHGLDERSRLPFENPSITCARPTWVGASRMNNQPSLHIGLTCQTLQEAYERLGIKDTSTPDGDVVAAFYEVYSTSTSTHDPGRKRLLAVKALEVISHRRQSQLLAFIRTIVSHLTQDNVLLLAPPPSSNFVNLTSDEAVEQTSNEQHSRSPGSPGATISYQASPTISSTGPSDNEVTLTPASGEDEDTAEAFSDRMSLVSEKTSSTGIGISSSEASSEEGSDQSDFDHPVGGKYWDGQHWCCEECNDELEDGRCPSGCPINPCRICGQECGLACPVACPICDNELATLCSGCHKSKGDYEKSSSDDCVMVRDELDKVWRCKDCLWEVEANSENEGHCHCRVDPNVFEL